LNSNTFRMPARRCAAAAAATALVAGPLLLAAPASATGADNTGRASAAVLRTSLDVSLLSGTVDVPLNASLNAVQAPATAEQTALSVRLDGVDRGKAVQVVRADVATATATADEERAEASSNLAQVRVHVPGLPRLAVIELEGVTSKAVCEAGGKPVAESNVLGRVRVLGKRITLTAGGPTRVVVPGVGKVTLELSKTRTTSRTAAATALSLDVSINPLALNVAQVEGSLALAEATCQSPRKRAAGKPEDQASDERPEAERPEEQPERSAAPAAGLRAQSAAAPAHDNLAETGGSSMTPYLAGGAAVLLAAGGAAVLMARSRARR
jgi:hypothetical protein